MMRMVAMPYVGAMSWLGLIVWAMLGSVLVALRRG